MKRYIISILISIWLTVLWAQPHFNYLTVNNGLSQNSITSIIQDSKGLIWIASYDGLNRFDGFNTLVKRHESNNNNSLSENRLLCLAERSDGKIWIGTEGGGVDVYNPDTEEFAHYTVGQGHIPSNTVVCLTTDSLGCVWVGTEQGLAKATIGSGGEVEFETVSDFGLVSKLLCDRRGNIWVASVRGLYVIPHGRQADGKPVRIHASTDPYIISMSCDVDNTIWFSTYSGFFNISRVDDISEDLEVADVYASIFDEPGCVVRAMKDDLDGNIWIGTENSGLFHLQFNAEGQVVEKHLYATHVPFCNISDNRIRTLFVDRTNVLWIGFHKKGVNYADICGKKFHLMHQLSSPVRNELGYRGRFISSIYQDSKSRLWFADEEEGMFIYHPVGGAMHYLSGSEYSKSISTVLESRSGDIWLGAADRLLMISRADASRNHYRLQHKLQYAEAGNIRTLCEDLYGNIWFGSITGQGLYRYNPQTGECTLYNEADGIHSVKLFYLSADRRQPVIWVGTLNGGLIRVAYHASGKEVETTTYNTTSGEHALISNHIWHIYADSASTIWVGTDAGLNRIELDDNRGVKHIAPIDVPLLNGLKIMAITEDWEHNFWLNCSQGLYKYNPATHEVQIYTHRDGLQSNTFTEASIITSDGTIYVGGINGVNYFRPSEIVKNPYVCQAAIVGLRIHDKGIKPTDELVLDYKSNNFMFEFVGIHYAIPAKNQFRFMLEGFDGSYVHTNSSLRVAAYSNLPAGKYTFKVMASNNDGVWGDAVKQIGITILPPPWKTIWAYLAYLLMATGLVYFVIHYLLTKQRLKNELYIERLEKEKIREVNEMKMGFFTNITHEFRTPLVLILSPLKDLMVDAKRQNKHIRLRLQIINRNATRLLSLINQTLDLRKISSDTMRLLITRNNLHNHIENMIESFEVHTVDRRLAIHFRNELQGNEQWYDKYKIDKVLLNIMSNAVKHTPPKGSIYINVNEEKQDGVIFAVISIRDTGRGIPAEELAKIFEMFYRARNASVEGTGIGLSYVKSLLNLHKGDIRVESIPDEGTCFTFRFPVNVEAYAGEQISETIDLDFNHQSMGPFIDEDFDDDISLIDEEDNSISLEAEEEDKRQRKTILVVEDNVDLRLYIKDCLAQHHNVLEASNGEEGIKMAKREQPDLIITDLMMPIMDGIEFSRALKADAQTRHIPIFVHSVKSDEIALKEAMDAGAEDFIAKPYNYATLIKKIKNFFRTREQLVARVQAEAMFKPTKPDIPSSDEELIQRIQKIIEENLSNQSFGVELLADRIGMSRMQLNRRIVSYTGLQPSALIRDVRLQRAAQLLKSGEKRISEVMWETGFNNHSRFNMYFKMKYGVGVKDYQKG